MSDIKYTKESLEGLSRKKLQALAKKLRIKANQKSTEIIDEILELQNTNESKRGDDESEDERQEAQHHQQRAQQEDGSQDEERSFSPPGTPPSFMRSAPQALLATRERPQPATPTRNGEPSEQLLYSPGGRILGAQSPPYIPTSPKSEYPSSPLAQPARLVNQQNRDYSPDIEAAPTRFRPHDATTGINVYSTSCFQGRSPRIMVSMSTTQPGMMIAHGPGHPLASAILAREEAVRMAQLMEEHSRTPEPAAAATPSPSPKEPKPEPYTPEAVPSTSNREITPPPYSPCEWPEGYRRQDSDESGSDMLLSPPARRQTPEELSERRNRFERQGSYRHFEGAYPSSLLAAVPDANHCSNADSDSDSDSPVSPIGVTRTPSPPVGPGVGDPYSPYGTTQVVDPYGGVDPYYEHEAPAIRYGGIAAISSISQRRRPQTPHPRARTNPQTPQTDNSLYNPGPPKEPTPQRETVYQLPGSNESWDSIHHGPRPEANDVYHAPGSPMEERASRRSLGVSQRSAPSARTLVEADVEEEDVDEIENANGLFSDSNKDNDAQPDYSAPNDPTDHRSRGPTPSSLPDYEDDEEPVTRVNDAPTSAEIQRFHVGVAAALAENARIRGTIHRQHLVMQGIQRRIGLIRDEVKRETGWEFGGLHNDENRPLSGEERMVKEQSARQRTGQENRARAPLAQLQDTQAIAPNNGSRGVKRARDEEGDEATQAAILESFKTTKKAREHEPAQEPENVQYWLTQEEEDDITHLDPEGPWTEHIRTGEQDLIDSVVKGEEPGDYFVKGCGNGTMIFEAMGAIQADALNYEYNEDTQQKRKRLV
ncbi:hypothetical protein D9611_008050 [Ephemerocybe angulata]|uniref:Uncharacterized protein n=1 Tax=Ephemerocybe angulata TaxID=980116 RepID=A0A8H5BZ47_9AGAR|nr:hypothetical protein D9611_008050 [Tulosesus angulatus]